MEVSQLPSSNVAFELKLIAVLSVQPHILLPPQTSAQSFSQSFVGSSSQFDKKEIVYSAGILSYSTYKEKISSFGILGNVFLTINEDEA